MKIIDLSQPLFDAAPNCHAHPPVSIRTEEHSDGGPDSWQMEFFDFASHTGSHVDAPLHKMAGGAGIESYPLEHWCGPAVVFDLRGSEADRAIGPADLSGQDVNGKIVLLATGWGERRAKTDQWLHHSPYVSPEGAQFLVDNGAKAVGIDHYSVGGGGEANARTHTILLGNGLWIVEELGFPNEVFALPSPFHFQALPLNMRGTEGRQFSGAPCRPVILVS